MLRKLLLLSLLFIASQNIVYSAITTQDHIFVANDSFSSDFHTRLNQNFTNMLTGGINSISTANVVDDTLEEEDMADEINPRIRTYEGAACEFVYTGLLPVTDSDLTSDISAGTAYPRGYRINKTSATSKTYTASRWTFVDVDINGDFQYSVVNIGAATPSVASNSIRLARVSTDGTTINDVTDLRTTSCTNGPFSNIGSGTGESNLDDVFKNGAPVRRFSAAGRTPNGFAQGAFISWDTHTTFKVTNGALYVNGEYRTSSTDITVPQTNDDPANSTSGLDTGSIAGSTTYYVYAVADQSAVKPFTVSYSTSASAPSGTTNYRLIGRIRTDANSNFVSRDLVTAHAISPKELVGAMVVFDGSGTVVTNPVNAFNISSIADNGTGTYTVTFAENFARVPAIAGVCLNSAGAGSECKVSIQGDTQPTVSSVKFHTEDDAGSEIDATYISIIAVGDKS